MRFVLPPYQRAFAGVPFPTGALPASAFEVVFTTPDNLTDGPGFFELVQAQGAGNGDMTVEGFGVKHSGPLSASIQLKGKIKPSTQYVIACTISDSTAGLHAKLTLPTPKANPRPR